MIRILYLLAMYSGVRAAFNTARGLLLPTTRVAIINGETFQIDASHRVKICVNSRPPCKSLGRGRRAGMISLSLTSPGISPLTYALLRITSHFGHGHIEIAFYEVHNDEVDDTVYCFAVRNIVRSNIDRLGWKGKFCKLKLASDNDEIIVLRRVIEQLNARGIRACLASPEECVAFAVNPSLLHSRQRKRTLESLTRRYKRIAKQLSNHDIPVHQGVEASRLQTDNLTTSPGDWGRNLHRPRLREWKAIIPQALLLLLFFWQAWELETYMAISAVYPIYIIFCLVSIGLLTFPLMVARTPRAAVAPCFWLIFLLGLPFFTTNALKPMLWGVAKLEPGMDRDAVLRTVHDSYSGTPYKRPRIHEDDMEFVTANGQVTTRILLKPRDRPSELGAESLLVFFNDGKYTHSSFCPD